LIERWRAQLHQRCACYLCTQGLPTSLEESTVARCSHSRASQSSLRQRFVTCFCDGEFETLQRKLRLGPRYPSSQKSGSTSKAHQRFYTLVNLSETRQKGKTLLRSLNTKAIEPLSGPQGLLYRFLTTFPPQIGPDSDCTVPVWWHSANDHVAFVNRTCWPERLLNCLALLANKATLVHTGLNLANLGKYPPWRHEANLLWLTLATPS
jgi:hypothetical protein